MRPAFVRTRRASALLAATATLTLLAACGADDVGAAKLNALKHGSPRSEVLTVLGTGSTKPFQPTDSLRIVSGYRVARYLSDGLTHEIIWYREIAGTTEDSITRTTDTPVVIVNDTLAGWGWGFYDKYAAQHKIPNPGRDRERLDSISQAQLKPQG
jgi:hypothetical protein